MQLFEAHEFVVFSLGIIPTNRVETYQAYGITEAIAKVLYVRNLKQKGWEKGPSGRTISLGHRSWAIVPIFKTGVARGN